MPRFVFLPALGDRVCPCSGAAKDASGGRAAAIFTDTMARRCSRSNVRFLCVADDRGLFTPEVRAHLSVAGTVPMRCWS